VLSKKEEMKQATGYSGETEKKRMMKRRKDASGA
jgi:hypothetical protein